jgi:hypothetical protein
MGEVVERAELGLEDELALAGELALGDDEELGGELVAEAAWPRARVAARAVPTLTRAARYGRFTENLHGWDMTVRR